MPPSVEVPMSDHPAVEVPSEEDDPTEAKILEEEMEMGRDIVGNWDTNSVSDVSVHNGAIIQEPHIVINVEVLMKTSSTLPDDVVALLVQKHIKKSIFNVGVAARRLVVKELGQILKLSPSLRKHINDLAFEESTGEAVVVVSRYKEIKWCFYAYRMEAESENGQIVGEDSPTASHALLPSLRFFRLWESLIFDSVVKNDLVQYALGTVLFSKLNVDSNLVTWNKVVLLHGPPGTGKTSLCKALAQKLSIRMAENYPGVCLVEINSHSLFSKWFSESGKLVMRLFEDIEGIIKQPSAPLVCLLLDEVESLSRARQASVSGNEPSDAVRAVNALLTQIDKIKQYPNVLILATSNISEAIDLAFIDRADIKQYIGNPSSEARENIFLSSLQEMVRTNVLSSDPALISRDGNPIHLLLKRISGPISEGMSGRALRKIPFLTHALKFSGKMGIDVKEFLSAMETTIEKHQRDVADLAPRA